MDIWTELTPVEEVVWKMRTGKPQKKFREIASVIGRTRQRAHQIWQRAEAKMKAKNKKRLTRPLTKHGTS